MKKVISVFIILALALSLSGAVWAPGAPDLPEAFGAVSSPESVSDPETWVPYAVTGGNIYFDPETQNIVGCDASVTEAVIPAEIDGKAVRMIVSMRPTSGSSQLQKAVVSDGILGIAERAFYSCGDLVEIQIPDSVTEIGERAFYYCRSLTSINLPPKITKISDYTFSYCTSLEKFAVSDNITDIGEHAFEYCTSLKNISISGSVRAIGYNALSHCDSLESIDVNENNTKYYSKDGVLFTRSYGNYPESLALYPMAKPAEEYTLPSVEIEDYEGMPVADAFSGNPYLKVLKISGGSSLDSRRYVNGKISDLKNLKDVYLPIDTNVISSGMFSQCYAITDVYYDGCAERWEKVKNSAGGDNGSLFAANMHFNENDHIIQGIELEVGEDASVAKFESESRTYNYNTYFRSKPFSLMENAPLVAMLDGSDLKVKVLMTGWDSITYELSRYNKETTNMAEHTIENVVPQSGETHIEVDLNMLGSVAYLGDIYVDSYGNIRTVLGTGKNTYTVSGTGFPVSFSIHFGSADLANAYGGELSDYEVEVYYISNGEKVVVGREKMSAAAPHEHVYGEKWLSDDQNHWHVCQKCSQTSVPEPHALVNGICSVCGYVRPEHVHNFKCVGAEGVHWDQCEECGYTTNVEPHKFENDVCTECGFKSVPQSYRFDLNGDGTLNISDGVIMQRALAGLI